MPVLKADDAVITTVKEGVRRRLIHTNELMMVVIDFDGGPWKQPDPPHSHLHEQTTYVVHGGDYLFLRGRGGTTLKSWRYVFSSFREGAHHTVADEHGKVDRQLHAVAPGILALI